jgi:hypothetical protein
MAAENDRRYVFALEVMDLYPLIDSKDEPAIGSERHCVSERRGGWQIHGTRGSVIEIPNPADPRVCNREPAVVRKRPDLRGDHHS